MEKKQKRSWKSIVKAIVIVIVAYLGISYAVVLCHTGAQYYKSGSETSAVHAEDFGLCHFWYSCPLYRSEFKNEHPVPFWTFGEDMPEGSDLGQFMGKEHGLFCPFCVWNCFYKPKAGRAGSTF